MFLHIFLQYPITRFTGAMAGVEGRPGFQKPHGDLLERMDIFDLGEVEPSDDPGGVEPAEHPVLFDDVHDAQMTASAEQDLLFTFLDAEAVFMFERIDAHAPVRLDVERLVPFRNELLSFDPAEEKSPVAKIGVLVTEDEAVAFLELVVQAGICQCLLIPSAVIGTERALLEVDRRLLVEGEKTVHPSAVIPMSVGKNRKIGGGEIDAQDLGVFFEEGCSPAVEEDLLRVRLYP